eukprot:443056-Pyramimonas_sp.AAC.1
MPAPSHRDALRRGRRAFEAQEDEDTRAPSWPRALEPTLQATLQVSLSESRSEQAGPALPVACTMRWACGGQTNLPHHHHHQHRHRHHQQQHQHHHH